MTKVQIHFRLIGALDEAMLGGIRNAQTIYGMERVQVLPSLTDLLVEYDASRLRLPEIENALRGCGINVEPKST